MAPGSCAAAFLFIKRKTCIPIFTNMNNMCVMVCAILIASVGLNTNSTAVIIGAMLISPLMGTILCTAYGTVSADYALVRKSLYGFLFQILYSFGTSFLAGIIGQTRKDKANNIIPGVAIATALMPPLCTCGYALANGKWSMLLGAAYLFLVNSYFIYMSSCLILAVLGIPQTGNMTKEKWNRVKKRMIRNAIVVALPAILIGLSVHFSG